MTVALSLPGANWNPSGMTVTASFESFNIGTAVDSVTAFTPDSRLELGADHEAAIPVRVRVRSLQIGGNRGQFALGAGLRHAAPKSSLEREVPGVARFEVSVLRIADQAARHRSR